MQSQKVMMTERIAGNDLLKYLPQQPPFVLISALEAVTEKGATTSFEIEASHVMVENNHLTEGGLIENMAQTAAAMTGYATIALGKTLPLGYIGAVKKLKINKLPAINSTLTTTVEITHEVFDFTIIKGEVFLQNELIAECEMNIFIQP